MVVSYTLARVQPAKDVQVYYKVKKLPEVEEVITTYGEYDIIVKVNVDSLEKLDEFVFHKLRTIEGVEATTTLIHANFPKEE
ncbi:Lrp/AsnC ligand binding domain-containing protein [Candidatus Bathyarchaeota archaeon]|nr:Lrp/AsnC ligand binding domain-containing protein [Candidatus Bathyarchaeota archaeon]MCK4703075.1 Lrp/AsnC ligand binding domain-containing protein [Candidatus Bathyarchaeota archaeon]